MMRSRQPGTHMKIVRQNVWMARFPASRVRGMDICTGFQEQIFAYRFSPDGGKPNRYGFDRVGRAGAGVAETAVFIWPTLFTHGRAADPTVVLIAGAAADVTTGKAACMAGKSDWQAI